MHQQMTQLDWVDQQIEEQAQVEAIEEYQSAIGRAIHYWSRGKHIPLTLHADLVDQGYNVPALEARYFKFD